MKTQPPVLTLFAWMVGILIGAAFNLQAQIAPTIITQPVSQANLAKATVSFGGMVAETAIFNS